MVSKKFKLSLGNLIFWILFCIFCEIKVIETTSPNGSGITATVKTLPPTLPMLTHFLTFRTETFQPEINLYNPGIADMEYYMKTQKKVINYLAGFKNEFQRTIVETQMKFCPYEPLCNFTVNASTDKKSCCAPCLCNNCETDRTCCPSVIDEKEFIFDNSTGQFPSTERHVEQTCILRHLTIRPSYEQKGFMAFSDCPMNTSSVLRYNCSRPYTKDLKINFSLPVFSNKSLLIFRNQFCAHCNGVAEEDIIFFHPVVSCETTELLSQASSEKEIIELIFANETCDLSFGFFDSRVQLQDCKYSISKCNVTGTWREYDIHLETACHLYESKFEHETYVFRNVFCALCNGMSLHTVTCEWFTTLKTDTFSFSGLLNLDFDQGFSTASLEESRLDQDSSCKTFQLYDPLTVRVFVDIIGAMISV
ncbi:uncharacterized protein LOC128549001 [Mercenaria mercenaria]|uniref:uncharacterized protein LOC128549001 n=1 Tax=Mercenaria mercenaria TaxID=6596 RepID=UPI00234E826B|nr:uncharacterized protein LOC128549001 [Mercenaria mercenaria]